MSRRREDRTIGELLARWRRGETISLPFRDRGPDQGESVDDPATLALLDELFDDWRQGRPLSADARDFLMYFIAECSILPLRSGRTAKSQQAKAAEAQAINEARQRYRQRRKQGVPPDAAAGPEARAAKKGQKTMMDLLRRKPQVRD
jgi:hypothetical protein